MIKYLCDACGKEIKGRNGTSFSYLCHLDDSASFMGGYVDNDMNPVSGREVEKLLCNKCYNLVMRPAVEALKALQHKNGLISDNEFSKFMD